MKIIYLNCWYGKAGEGFYKFMSKNSSDTDIFCLSEVQPDLFANLQNLLPDFSSFYDSTLFDSSMGYLYGQAVFVKNKFNMKKLLNKNLFRQVYNDMGILQNFDVYFANKVINFTNIHGKARPGHKLDTSARIRQSRKIIDYLKNIKNPKIIGGDFNLLPTTKSVRMFEEENYTDLIKRFDIKDTRGELNHNKFALNDRQYYADYCFTTPDIKVINFDVPNVEISDHLPLIIEFEL